MLPGLHASWRRIQRARPLSTRFAPSPLSGSTPPYSLIARLARLPPDYTAFLQQKIHMRCSSSSSGSEVIRITGDRNSPQPGASVARFSCPPLRWVRCNLFSRGCELPGKLVPHDRSAPRRMRHIDAHGISESAHRMLVGTSGLQTRIASFGIMVNNEFRQ